MRAGVETQPTGQGEEKALLAAPDGPPDLAGSFERVNPSEVLQLIAQLGSGVLHADDDETSSKTSAPETSHAAIALADGNVTAAVHGSLRGKEAIL